MKTERLVLREPAAEDADVVRAYHARNAARLARWEPVPVDTAAAARAWIDARHAERRDARATSFLAFDAATTELAGLVVLGGFSVEPVVRAMLSYSVDAAFEGRGYAVEAVRRVIAYASRELGVREFSAYYDPANARSERLLERLGFRVVARTEVVPGLERFMRANVLAQLDVAPEPLA